MGEGFANALADNSQDPNYRLYVGHLEEYPELTAWLCEELDLTTKEVIRHYDVTGKECPKSFVEDEDAWKQFRKDVKKAMR